MHPIHHFLRRARLGGGGRLAAGVALAAGLLTGAASADASTGGFDVPEPLLAVARAMEKQARDAEDLLVETVAVRDGARDGERAFDVTIDGVRRTVTLRPFSVRTDGTTAYEVGDDGVMVPVELPPTRTWRGEVTGRPGMVAAATLMADGTVRAMLHEPGAGTWGVEPLEADVPGLPVAAHAVYRDRDLGDLGVTCGTTEAERIAPADAWPGGIDPAVLAAERAALGAGHIEAGARVAAGGSGSRTQVLIDADWEYFSLNGFSTSNTIADIETLLNAVGLIYQEQTGICYAVSAFVIRTSFDDPYSGTNGEDLLGQFRAEWSGQSVPARDLAHLFTGREIDGTEVGRAFLGVVCSQAFGYAYSQAQFTDNFTDRTQLVAHELGHNWNACHCNTEECTGGSPDPDCGIMTSFVNGSLDFGSRSLSTIEAHRASRTCLGPCFSPHFVDASATGFENGTILNPWDTWGEGYQFVTVGGIVFIRDGNYPEPGTYSKRMTVGLDGGGTATIGD